MGEGSTGRENDLQKQQGTHSGYFAVPPLVK